MFVLDPSRLLIASPKDNQGKNGMSRQKWSERTEIQQGTNLEYESILYNSTELSIDWTSREFQNQTVLFLNKFKSSI